MSWLTVFWSMAASACLTFAFTDLLIWFKNRKSHVHLFFALAAIAVAALAMCELRLMFSSSPEEAGRWIRWLHVPIFVAVVSLVCFIWFGFRTGRAWLAWSVCAVRLLALVLNFGF